MSQENALDSLFSQVLENIGFILAVFSSPLKDVLIEKISIRPLKIKNERMFQVSEYKNQQVFHKNFSLNHCLKYCIEQSSFFKQVIVQTTEENYQVLRSKNGVVKILKKSEVKPEPKKLHNRTKEYLWKNGEPISFLVELDIMDQKGNVYHSKWDKFRQINRFLEMIDDCLDHLKDLSIIKIIDFGCGKSYLTFALYHFLKFTKGLNVQITGLDLKKEVIENCQNLAIKLGYDKELQFLCADINAYEAEGNVDLMVSLHACDTATDAALEKAVRWGARVILAVPCCQHELYKQVKQEILQPLLKHGILKERFASLLTDTLRVQLLEVLGYQAQVIEFIETEHTPKNLLIRAFKKEKNTHQKEALKAYNQLKQFFHVSPSLENRFKNEIDLLH